MTWELAIVGGLIGICFILIYLGNNLDTDIFHTPIRMVLFGVALFTILIVLNLDLQVVDANNSTMSTDISSKIKSQISTAYQAVLWTTIVYLSYLMIMFLLVVFRGFPTKK